MCSTLEGKSQLIGLIKVSCPFSNIRLTIFPLTFPYSVFCFQSKYSPDFTRNCVKRFGTYRISKRKSLPVV